MKWMRLVLATVVGSGMIVTTGSGPALACSCAFSRVEQYVGAADVIVGGKLIEMRGPRGQAVMSTSDPLTYTVEVDEIFSGDVSTSVEFTSPWSGASCGLEGMVVDRRYVLFLNEGRDGLTASLCGGSGPASERFETQIARITGERVEMPPGDSTHGTPEMARNDDDSPAQWAVPAWMIAAGGFLVLVVGLGTAIRLIRRRRPSPTH